MGSANGREWQGARGNGKQTGRLWPDIRTSPDGGRTLNWPSGPAAKLCFLSRKETNGGDKRRSAIRELSHYSHRQGRIKET
jgi:hypothetical protein